MRHLRQMDAQSHTVLMVQVENEVGVIPQSRDHSRVAEVSFAAAVPAPLLRYLQEHRDSLSPDLRSAWQSAGTRTNGSWREVFGNTPLTDDLFMSWQYATYINAVAEAGKTEYALPLFVNAALIRPNYLPGQYNSGGPLPQSMDVWHAGAPNIDLLCPDIYFNDFEHWARAYTRPDNPLFVPESQGGSAGAANAIYSFGNFSAIGFSPFGIDEEGNAPVDLVGITNPGERPDNAVIAHLYSELSSLAPTILQKQQAGEITAALVEGEAQRSARVSLGEYTANLMRAGNTATPSSRVGAMFIRTGENEFLVIGSGDGAITFSTESPGAPQVGIESIDEQILENEKWAPRRRINGDEDSHGQVLRLYATDLTQARIYRVRLYRYR